MKRLLCDFFQEEDGIQTLERVIILVVLVSIAFAFKRTLLSWYNELMTQSTLVNTATPVPAEPSLNLGK